MFERIDLKETLKKERAQRIKQDPLKAVNVILARGAVEDREILCLLKKSSGKNIVQEGAIGKLLFHKEAIFSTEEIKQICVRYRLRFLNSKFYKGEIPYEAFIKIKSFKRTFGFMPDNFKIIAPAQHFQLKDCQQDPLLFAQLSNGKFYLLHSWGNDLAGYRKIMCFPFRNIGALALSCTVVALIASIALSFTGVFAIPGEPLSKAVLYSCFFFFTLTGFLFTVSIISGLLGVKDFSENCWESRFFNY